MPTRAVKELRNLRAPRADTGSVFAFSLNGHMLSCYKEVEVNWSSCVMPMRVLTAHWLLCGFFSHKMRTVIVPNYRVVVKMK